LTKQSILSELEKAKKASAQIRRLKKNEKSQILKDLSNLLMENLKYILEENQKDLDLMDAADSKYDRLLLNADRVKQLSKSLLDVSLLNDPTETVLAEKVLSNGINLSKINVPMGVVAAIFESRPNVTIDVAALCIMSGNGCVLKGGKEAHFSNKALVNMIHASLEKNGILKESVCLLPTDRQFLQEVLNATKFVDLVIPRGSQSLIEYVRENSKIPTIETGAGVCHAYIESSADLRMATEIIINGRASRPSVCNSIDCVLVDKSILNDLIPLLKEGFEKFQISVYADGNSYQAFYDNDFKNLQLANEDDFGKEWLDYKISVKTVEGLNDALHQIEKFSSRHSEAIVTSDDEIASIFLEEVDAAAVYHNASTRFTDGGEFGLGAEIGISTQKLHARGPFALEKLVTEKWILRGNGQVRW
jgi:glutamate-5-semialdehyde dehydrogenase